jgi:hypothetical protein
VIIAAFLKIVRHYEKIYNVIITVNRFMDFHIRIPQFKFPKTVIKWVIKVKS